MLGTAAEVLKFVYKRKLTFLLAAVAVFVGHTYLASDSSIPRNTVKITNMTRNSGGSGVVLSSHKTHSEVLTNAHVCRVASKGGLVTSYGGHENLVSEMTFDTKHDLCIITVYTDLNANVKLAQAAPEPHDYSLVSGHPRLLPQTQTKGQFGNRTTIQVATGLKPCTPEDIATPGVNLACLILGGVPIIQTYQAVVITNRISPGSSGSAIYNADNELSGLVFAGSQDGSEGFIVPYENVVNFLHNYKTLEQTHVNYERSFRDVISETRAIKNFCQTYVNNVICSNLTMDLLED